MSVADIPGDGFHRPRSVKGDHGDQILHAGRLQLRQYPLHAGAFKLKYTAGFPLGHHPVHRRIVQRNLIDPEVRLQPLDCPAGIPDHRQVPQSEKIHFQQSQFLDGGHGVLGDNGIVVFA